jgi:mannosylglycerate hydrolase
MRLHLVSHTHWDREWYLTFQQFRLRLVHLVDGLLQLLKSDPDYRCFTLDGQTIILEDYLEVRPEREAEIRELVKTGKLLIGPWYILSDEFLVSPEATLRNLMEGDRISSLFGRKMNIGYLPDPFGHFGQMPQVLCGFGIDSACLQRGLDDQPPELVWQAPDGSQVFLVYLRDGYGNAAGLPVSDHSLFTEEVCRLRDSLLEYSAAGRKDAPPGGHLLLMHGTDHMAPLPETPAAMSRANETWDKTEVVHSSLPEYIRSIRSYLDRHGLVVPLVKGELRSSRRFHLLPGVLSSRMWIKQRNFTCENLLEKWAEPFSAFAQLSGSHKENDQLSGIGSIRVRDAGAILRYAWRLLMTCHPHDSICGCSIDQVHEEMRSRFDQVEQVGEEIVRQSLEALAEAVDTRLNSSEPDLAVVVFNPGSGPRTDYVRVDFPTDWNAPVFAILDEEGQSLPYRVKGSRSRDLMNATLDKDGMRSLINTARDGRAAGFSIRNVKLSRKDNQVLLDVQVSEMLEPDQMVIRQTRHEMEKYLEDPAVHTFSVQVRTETETSVEFAPQDVPPLGWRTFWILPLYTPVPEGADANPDAQENHTSIANEFLAVEFDSQTGCFNLQDKRSGHKFNGLNRFVDGGDCGDEYNYSPPEQDLLVEALQVGNVSIDRGPVRQSITAEMRMEIPRSLTPDRSARSEEKVSLSIRTTASLTDGLARLDFQTRIDNRAEDHRLRVGFLIPFKVEDADHDGHFEVVRRPTRLPDFDETWIEAPRPEVPQRYFTYLHSDYGGLAVANRGLPEVEVHQVEEDRTEVALTLLRCTGWLSRDDFSTRKGHAGPGLPTPGAQEQGEHWFEYAVLPTLKESRSAAYRQARYFSAPLRAAATHFHSGELPAKGSFVQVDPVEIEVSAVKLCEKLETGKSSWIVRGYNQSSETVQVTITPFRPFPLVSRVNLAEEILGDLEADTGGGVSLSIGGCEIFTVLFREG